MAVINMSSSSSANKPVLSFWKIWNMSFGFMGVQIGYSLQNANTSSILSAIGADPHHLSLFWLAAPMAGFIVQPIVGLSSDKTWTRMGRRIPFILGGSIVSALAMFFMPNSGNFANMFAPLLFGAVMLLLMDTSFNVTMQPFRALVSDMVSDKQRNQGYAVQSFLINAGAVVGSLLPFILDKLGILNVPTHGNKVAPTVIWSFYIGGSALLLSVLWTSFTTKEYPPEEYAKYNNLEADNSPKMSFLDLLKNIPSTMWQLSVTQFFSWFALFLMWVFTTQGTSQKIWGVNPNEYKFAQDVLTIKGTDSINQDNLIFIKNSFDSKGDISGLHLNKQIEKSANEVFKKNNDKFPTEYASISNLKNSVSDFNDAGKWTGVLFAAYSLFAALYSLVLTRLTDKFGSKNTYMFSLICGGIGLISMMFVHEVADKNLLFFSMIGIGMAWASILALPYSILSSSLPARQTGVYMGIFNATITIPQIAAGLLGGVVLTFMGDKAINVIGIAGVSMVIAGVMAKLVIQTKD